VKEIYSNQFGVNNWVRAFGCTATVHQERQRLLLRNANPVSHKWGEVILMAGLCFRGELKYLVHFILDLFLKFKFCSLYLLHF